MDCYYNLLEEILNDGNDSDDRTGTGTLSLFGKHLDFDLKKGFPLLPGKFTPFKLVANELLWFISGSTNNEELRRMNGNDKPTIWEEWADEDGYLGPIYGSQWRNWAKTGCDSGIDQIANLITGLKERPFSRRHIISAWNVSDLPDESISPQDNVSNFSMALAPCHAFFQFGVRKLSFQERIKYCPSDISPTEYYEEEYHKIMDDMKTPKYALSCHLYQRSCDTFLGLPFNIASYALLTHMIANVVDMVPDRLHISFGDVHLYKNHLDQANELLGRDLSLYPLPTLEIDTGIKSIDDFTFESFTLHNAISHARIPAPIAI
jgi:thymidylate synthase